MKVKFELKGVVLHVDGDVPAAFVALADELAKQALAEIAKAKAKLEASKTDE